MSVIDQIQAVLEEIKLQEITRYDMREKSSLTDVVVVASAESSVQLDAARSKVEELMWKHKVPLKNPSEEWGGGWLLMDYGDLIVNVFLEEKRSFYNLDDLLRSQHFDIDEIKNVHNR
ncbi:MAG: ribosome silencing factor [Brevinematales bacterium]|nr:ribosome silencing factor [Brevinematales bacterium]